MTFPLPKLGSTLCAYIREMYGKFRWPSNISNLINNPGRIAVIHNGNLVESDSAHILYVMGNYYAVSQIECLAPRPVKETTDPLITIIERFAGLDAYHIIHRNGNIYILNRSAPVIMMGTTSKGNEVVFVDPVELEYLPFKHYCKLECEITEYTRDGNVFTIGGRKYRIGKENGREINPVTALICHYRVYLCDGIHFVAFYGGRSTWTTAQLYADVIRTKPALH